MATPRQVKQTSGLALLVGFATMGLSSSVAGSSGLAGAATFCVGLGLVGVSIWKFRQAASGRC